jgi:hypothetical protein
MNFFSGRIVARHLPEQLVLPPSYFPALESIASPSF